MYNTSLSASRAFIFVVDREPQNLSLSTIKTPSQLSKHSSSI